MPLFNAHKTSQGFTLIEILTVLLIIGILAAITVPSFLALLNKSKVSDALTKLRGALQETQREAIRKSKTCTIYLPDAATQAQIVSNCFVTGDGTSSGLSGIPNGLPTKTLDKIAIASNLTTTPKRITFSFRGNTTSSGKIVLYISDGSTQEKKCLAISNGLGIMRTGDYSGSTSAAADITAGTCTTLE